MSGLKIRWGGATVAPSQVKVRSGGVWADPAAVWVRDGGAWVKVWPNIAVYLENVSAFRAVVSGTATASINFDATQVRRVQGPGTTYPFTWLVGGASADYDVRATLVSGTSPAGAATGTWLNSPSGKGWRLSRSSVGTDSCVLLVEIRPAGGGATLASATWDIGVEYSA